MTTTENAAEPAEQRQPRHEATHSAQALSIPSLDDEIGQLTREAALDVLDQPGPRAELAITFKCDCERA